MTILALEFSSEQRSVAILRGNVVSEVVESGGRNTPAFGMIERALVAAGMERGQVDRIAVGLGPGSYTGIRSAIAIAQGWQLACGVELTGVSSVEAIAVQAQAEKMLGRTRVVVDAQRGEIYSAEYEITSLAARQVGALRIMTAEQWRTDVDRMGAIGPEATKWFPSGKIVFPRAATIARRAVGKDGVPGEKLEPIYLRETAFIKAPASRTIG